MLSGNQNRTFSHVEDICEILGNVPLLKGSLNKTINRASNENFQLIKLAELVTDTYNVKVQYKEWPKLYLLIESGDTKFNDSLLQSIFQYCF
jgi:dTDP-D-glucose 4,6-dehydratase